MSESVGEGFLAAMEPLAREGNPLAAAYSLKMWGVRGDAAAEQAVVDDLQQRMTAMCDVLNRFAESITEAFGVSLGQLANRLAEAGLLGSDTDTDDDDDQVDYDPAPEGCWATSAFDDDEACDDPAVDALGLCEAHRAAMVTDP